MNDYRIELGIGLKADDLAEIKKKINSLEDNPIKLKVDAETTELTRTIKEALNGLSKGSKNALTLDTSKLEGSIADIRDAVVDLKKVFGSLDDGANFKPLLSSINQIANALGKVENESDNLVKSLSALSKRDFNINFGIDMGKKNNNMIAYGRAARKQVIPELEAQIKELEGLFGGQQATMRKLTTHGKNVGFDIFTDFGDFNSDSAIKKMEAMEKYIDSLKKLAVIDNIKLDGFNEVHKNASELIDDIAGVESAVDKAGDVPDKLKNIFGSGVNADSLNIQLDDIVANLNEIKVVLQGLSSGNPLNGLTQSFDRLSGSIENLLANAEKVKGVLGSVDVGKIDVGIGTTKKNDIQTRKNNSGSEIDGFLKEFNLTGESAKIVRDKFASLTEAMSHGINSDAYEESLADLINTVKRLGTVSKQADNDMESILNTLQGYHLDVSGDYYKQEFGDDWKSARNKNQAILANKNSRIKTPVDVAYEELSGAYPLYFPKDIWNPADQLRKIFEVHDDARYGSKNRKVDVSEAYSDSNLRDWTSDIVGGIREQTSAERQLAQSSAETTKTIVQNEISQKQALEQKKHRLEEINKLYENYNNRVTNLAVDSNLDDDAKIAEYDSISREIDKLEQEENLLKSQIKSIETALESVEQQAKQTADAIQNISKETSLIRDDVNFKRVFDSDNQSAKEAQQYFQNLLANEKAVISVKENFDNSIGDGKSLKSFTVDIQRATGEVEKLHYAMSDADNDNRFLYQGASVSDKNIEKQTEARIKSADRLRTQLEEIKTKYKDMGSAKPIKDSDHINALDKQYRKVEKAIDNVRNADNTMSASSISNAEKQKSVLENMVREYRNAETLATSLRSKDIKTVGATYSSDLDVLISKMRKDGVYTSGFENGAENLRSMLSDAVVNKDKNGLVGFLNGLDKLEAGYKRASAAKKEFNQSESVGINTSKLNDRIENLRRISPEIDKFETEINGVKVTVKSLLNDLNNIKVQGDFTVVNKRFDAFEAAAEATGIAVKETVASTNSDFNRLKYLAKEINSIEFKLAGLDDSKNEAEVNELVISLERLHREYDELFTATSKNLSGGQISQLDDIFAKAGDKLRQLDAQIADAKAKFTQGIKINIELGNFENEMDAMRTKFNGLSDANVELRTSVESVENAYQEMLKVANANTGDEVADRERLIQAEKEYVAALEKTNNLIKIQARADKVENDKLKLQDNREKFQVKIDAWMAKNSAATKQFGAQLLDLRAKAEKADQVDLNHLEAELYKIDKAADKAGLKMQSFGDQIKSKFKEYMAYFSVAEVFMYVEQGLREMFNTVKEIDTAMTGLYRVTDLTAHQYDTLFNNMINSAKEYGATLNDVINATTDWVRAGFDADVALGMAEVTTMYQHISDLDYDTAAENLITAYNGFKNELNGAFDGDQVAAVEYIADILNELDNNFAVTSAGLGEALKRSASALDLAGNSIQETAG